MDKKILAASGIDQIDETLRSLAGYEVAGQIKSKSELIPFLEEHKVDIIVLSENLLGKEPILEIMFAIKMNYREVRVVFLTGEIENSPERKQFFEALVFAGIYDIVHESKISDTMLQTALDNPKSKEDVNYLVKKTFFSGSAGGKFSFENTKKKETEKDYYDNVFSVSSIKPGTGKTTISANVATTIAAFGNKREDGKPPRVALIEADLQNLSLGTILQIEDDEKNLLTAFKAIGKLFDMDNKFIGDEIDVLQTDRIIDECFLPYPECKNLSALVGSQLTLDQFIGMEQVYYFYIMARIYEKYDVIVIDTNSSLAHSTTYPFLQMSNKCFYVLNLDYNNVRNNVRYTSYLRELNVLDKIRYVLNEDIPKGVKNTELGSYEDLKYNANDIEKRFDFVAKIPMIPKVDFLNTLYEGRPICLDTKDSTKLARYEIAKIANEIWPMSDYLAEFRSETSAPIVQKKEKRGLFGRKK